MEILHWLGFLFSFVLIIYKLLIENRPQHRRLPPCPLYLPIIGHLHRLKKPIHQTLDSFSNQYGPILYLWFGARPVLVVSSPSAIEECFTKNDIIFANRPRTAFSKHLGNNYTSVGSAPYGNHWRNLRRFTTLEIFSSTRLQLSSVIRVEEVRYLIRQLFTGFNKGIWKVELKSIFFLLTFNTMMQMVAGNRYFIEYDMSLEKTRKRLQEVKETFETIALLTLGDFFPFLRWVSYLGAEKKMVRKQKKRDAFVQGLIKEYKNSKSNHISASTSTVAERERTIIDALLSLQESEPEYYNDNIMKGIIQTVLTAGTETSAVTMEWTMSLLLNHPEVLQKARDEIDASVRPGCLLDDTDLPKLKYLHCIIKETLRVCSMGPGLLPRESSEECTVGGFNIPRGTMLMVNAWAIHRDPKVWEDPTSFKPERFEGAEGEKEKFKLIPFGVGRRGCPGESLAVRLMMLTLGTLIQCFEWERVGEEHVDLSVGKGVTLKKEKPLEAIYRPRNTMINILSQL